MPEVDVAVQESPQSDKCQEPKDKTPASHVVSKYVRRFFTGGQGLFVLFMPVLGVTHDYYYCKA
jgi:hypothetical protein